MSQAPKRRQSESHLMTVHHVVTFDPFRYGFFSTGSITSPGVEIVCYQCKGEDDLPMSVYKGKGCVLERMLDAVQRHEKSKHVTHNVAV